MKLNGKRILRFHGRQVVLNGNVVDYKLNLGVSPDLSASALIPCYIRVKPSDRLTVEASNLSDEVARPMGFRLHGYLNSLDARKEGAIR